ncbi:MAG TPA: GMC family oxidoreductase [Methylophilus sp.]|uniref:GMC family oxidoreductase n=1 Tax=Methylophilus sp. TaxID=29541 RepID=UPI002CA2CF9E|nr:GMC family oxidoreductase [Methylophilus sp.]HSH88040.1 GMC family oxidoreductase [Methylophilus sp.]
MISNLNQLTSGSIISADVCIVGAGAAGISLALSLSGRGLKILLLESGFELADDPSQNLYQGEVVDEKLHSPPDKYRQRRFGGSTTIWGGRCMPFDPIDFEQRDYVPNSGWPISYEDLKPYYIVANRLLEAGDYEYDADKVFDAEYQAAIKGFQSDFIKTNNLERFSCPTNLGDRYKQRLILAKDVEILLGANCTGIRLDANGNHVTHLDVASLQGIKTSVNAHKFILATGGIETARLLLASNDVLPMGIGNQHDLVGRYYQCHIAGNLGKLTVFGPTSNVRHGYEVSPEGIYCRRRFALTPEKQKEISAGNMVARLHFPKIVDPSHRIGVLSGLFLAQNFISYEYGKRLKDGQAKLSTYLKHFANIILDPIDTSKFLYHWITKRTLAKRKFPSVILNNKSNQFTFEIHGEQYPNPDSRITLIEATDALGMRKVKVDWKYLPADIESIRRSLNVFVQEINQSGLATFEYNDDLLEEDLTRFGAYGGHHIGTARMGADPETSVVDANCKLHQVDNLYIASAAVFPTSSQANPTLTITAISLRLADHIAETLGVGKSTHSIV